MHEPAIKPAGVTPKTWQGLKYKSKTFVAEFVKDGNALRAYLKAGYDIGKGDLGDDKHKRNAYQVTKGKRVAQALVEHNTHRQSLSEAKAAFTLDHIVIEHERLMEAAEAKGDLATATANLAYIGKTRGVYKESMTIDLPARLALADAEHAEATKITRLLMEGEAAAEVVDLEVEEPEEEPPPNSSPAVPAG